MKLTNNEIYTYAVNLAAFNNLDIYIPVKANFNIQKNIAMLTTAAQEIEKAKIDIANHYGTQKDDHFNISEDKIEVANAELADLFSIEQELDLKTITLADLGSVELKPAQMQAIMFMIEE